MIGAPFVSVVIPCFRAADTLRTAVESVLRQTWSDLEVIIVDDGSPDQSLRVALTLAEDDPRIRVLSQANAGPAVARNRGIAASVGTLIAFLDADDRWTSDYLAEHVAHFARSPGCGAAFARVAFFDPAMHRAGRVSARVRSLTLAKILGENAVCTTSNLVARASLFREIGTFDARLTHAEDQEWVARVLAKTRWQVLGLPTVMVHYRTSPAGLSGNLDLMREGWLRMLAIVRSYARSDCVAAQRDGFAIFHRFLARRALRGETPERAFVLMLRAWRASPRALLTDKPSRTALVTLGAVAALLPGNPARALLSR
jgi:glycosyltransferase involved in cell wall biosynthesis